MMKQYENPDHVPQGNSNYEETCLRAFPRHGGSGRFILSLLIRRRGVPSGAASFIANNYEVYTFHYSHLFNSI
jgi:hypothetical protein